MTPATLKSIIFEIDEYLGEFGRSLASDPPDPSGMLKSIRRTLKAELTRATPVEQSPLYGQIVHVYNNLLSEVLPTAKLSDTRIRAIAARIDDDPSRVNVKWWGDYFRAVSESDFLTGRATKWRASFDFLVNRANMQKVLDGNYVNRGSPRPSKESEVDDYLDAVARESQNRLARVAQRRA